MGSFRQKKGFQAQFRILYLLILKHLTLSIIPHAGKSRGGLVGKVVILNIEQVETPVVSTADILNSRKCRAFDLRGYSGKFLRRK